MNIVELDLKLIPKNTTYIDPHVQELEDGTCVLF